MVLSDYITQVRRLLHDSEGKFYSDSELTDYINEGRERVVRDTGCNRQLQTLTLTANQETYAYTALPSGNKVIDVLNVSVDWGNLRYACGMCSWTEFNARYRQLQSFVSRPVMFSIYGMNTVYLAPIPDQAYVAEFDTVVLPDSLVTDSSTEVLISPYTSPVKYYAAYLAKFNEQSYGEADAFEAKYKQNIQAVLSSIMTRRIPFPYSNTRGAR